jgi:LuxR family quorum sensing-dependent transcriptional regulator
LCVINEASEFDIRDGVTVSIWTQEGRAGGSSFSGTHIVYGVKERQLLSIVANYAFVKALKFDARSNAASVLSDRQRAVLGWVEIGKTDWEIRCVFMNVSEHIVDKYIRAIKENLGANSRVDAIARAMRLGLID